MVNRRDFLKDALVLTGALSLGLGGMESLVLPSRAYANVGKNSLAQKAADKGLFYGAATSRRLLSTDSLFRSTFIEECGIMVPEWELKWKALRPSPTAFDFATFDWFIGFSTTNNILFRGHTLVWHDDLPPWFGTTVNTGNASRFMVDHIETVMKRHAGKVHSWDVVNEPIATWDRHPDGYRTSSPWYRFLGIDYIDLAFRTAAKADPKAMLVLNQNHIEQSGDGASMEATYRLLKRLKANGTPIHALGIESHLTGGSGTFDKNLFGTFLKKVADLGLKIIVTELDVQDRSFPRDIGTRDRLVANAYGEYLATALAEPAVIGVLTWGLSDRYTWLAKFAERGDKAPVRVLPMDSNLVRKPAWYAMAHAFEAASKRQTARGLPIPGYLNAAAGPLTAWLG